jgi:phospholipase C
VRESRLGRTIGHPRLWLPVAIALATLGSDRCAGGGPRSVDDALGRVQHIVVIYGENRSFDNLYGLFPGANGVANATADASTQVDRDGSPLKVLPPIWNGLTKDVPEAATRSLPNRPFRIDDPKGFNQGAAVATRDLVHRFYQNQMQVNGGRLDKYAAWSDAGGLAMGYYDGSSLPVYQLARQYTLADNFFMGAWGGSFLNHLWLVCACTPTYPDAANGPAKSRLSAVEADGITLTRAANCPASALDGPPVYANDGALTPDGFAVNTVQPPYQPSGNAPAPGGDPRLADPANTSTLPAQTITTIGDTLSAKGITWAWYAGAWQQALDDRSVIYKAGTPNFQPHHQPFNYFARFAPGTADRAEHLKDYRDLLAAISSGTLPQVVFYKPQGDLNQHPGYADVYSGDVHIAELVGKIQAGPQWSSTLIIVTYDENGGFWDHVPPPKGDRWGPGTRIPSVLISPLVKKRFVDHTRYDTTSILKLITRRFGLTPLPGVRAGAGDLTAALTCEGCASATVAGPSH